MEISWLSLLPPLIVVVVAFVSQSLNKSLFAGILSAALVATNFSPWNTAHLIGERFGQQIIDPDKLYLYIFLLAIAALVTLYNYTGCAIRFAHMITKKIKNKRAVQYASIAVSISLFIDDYLSILVTGFVMSPIMDRFAISRQKLAFLVHSLAGTVAILAPVSSWVATITVYLNQSGIDVSNNPEVLVYADPFFIYLKTLPFMFYSLLIIASTWFIVRKSISFGPMRDYEINTKAIDTTNSTSHRDNGSLSGAVANLLVPLSILIFTMFFGMLYAGGYYLLGGTHSFIDAIKNNDQSFLVMAVAGIAALIAGLLISLSRTSLTTQEIPRILTGGFQLMHSAITMVFLAAVLGVMLKDDTQTGQYLASLLFGLVPLSLLPLMFFIGSFIVTVATGGAWATFSLMLAIAVPMLTSLLSIATPAPPEAMPVLFPILGAIFSGAICGDHLSPISETTVMTATSTGTDPLTHAYTQFFYTLPAVIASMIAFIISGYLAHYPTWINIGTSLGTALCVCFGLLTLLNKNK